MNQPALIHDQKTDYNDILKVQGAQTVREYIDQSRPFNTPIPVPVIAPQAIQQAIDRFEIPHQSPAHSRPTQPENTSEINPKKIVNEPHQQKNTPTKQREVEREL